MATMTASIKLKHGTTLQDILAQVDAVGIPLDAAMTVSTIKADRPWQADDVTLVWNWEHNNS